MRKSLGLALLCCTVAAFAQSSGESGAELGAELPGADRRAQLAPIYYEQAAGDTAEFLVVLQPSAESARSKSAITLPIADLPSLRDSVLAEVVSEAIGLGAAIHQIDEGKQASFFATLDVRAQNWLRGHPAVSFIDGSSMARAAIRAPLNLGGREFAPEERGTTETRILRNGAIVGFGASGYQQPFISSRGNMIGDAAGVLGAYGYVIRFNGTYFEAVRNGLTVILRNGSSTMELRISSGQSTTVAMPEVGLVRNGRMMVPARILLERGALAAIIDWDQDTRSLQTYDYNVLDTGIYFYGVQQNSIRSDQPGAQKYIPGQPNPFFNPNNPTIIYAHGWQKDGVVNRGREGFLFTLDGQWQNVQNYWLTQGWNVGIFHWVQLADDDFGAMPVDTEKKIYDANSRNIGMRWKNASGQFSGSGNPTNNVTQIYRAAYLQVASALVSGKEIRLIGNSLGGNLTVAMVRELAINGQRLPLRVTLQDPYWDPSLDASDGITLPGGLASNRAVARDGAQRISNAGLALEYFRSSIAGQTGYVRDVALISSYTNLQPDYTANPIAKHTQPTRVYLWAYGFAGTVATPRTAFSTVRARMNTNSYWTQAVGPSSRSATPADDAYSTVTGKPN